MSSTRPFHPTKKRKQIKVRSSTLRRRNLRTQQSAVILDLRLRTSLDYRDVIVQEQVRFQSFFSFTLKRKVTVFKILRFKERFPKSSVFLTDWCGVKAYPEK